MNEPLLALAPMDHLVIILALWAMTHASAEIGRKAGYKEPLSCQFCTAGWVCLLAAGILLIRYLEWRPPLVPLAWWAVSALLEAVYNRLYTFFA